MISAVTWILTPQSALDTFDSALNVHILYFYMVTNYLNPMALLKPVWCVGSIVTLSSYISCASCIRSVIVRIHYFQFPSLISLYKIHVAITVSLVWRTMCFTHSFSSTEVRFQFFYSYLVCAACLQTWATTRPIRLTIYSNALLKHSQPRKHSSHRLDRK